MTPNYYIAYHTAIQVDILKVHGRIRSMSFKYLLIPGRVWMRRGRTKAIAVI